MKSEKEEYISILKSANSKEMKEFLLKYGKKPKPINPIYFIPKEEEVKDG